MKEMVETKLESLANELLFDIFERLTVIDLLHAFHHLNSRFDTLLLKHFYGYNLDHSIFQRMTKLQNKFKCFLITIYHFLISCIYNHYLLVIFIPHQQWLE